MNGSVLRIYMLLQWAGFLPTQTCAITEYYLFDFVFDSIRSENLPDPGKAHKLKDTCHKIIPCSNP